MAVNITTDVAAEAGPPEIRLSPQQWVRQNLFRTWYDTLLTLVFGAVGLWAMLALARAFFAADFTILRRFLAFFMVGQDLQAQIWRPAVAIVLTAVLFGYVAGAIAASNRDRARESGLAYRPTNPVEVLKRSWPVLAVMGAILLLTSTPGPALVAVGTLAAGVAAYQAGWRSPVAIRRRSWLVALLLLVAIYLVLVGGGIGWGRWGGLQLNLFLTVAGIALAFPLGLLLALGRRSSLPAVRWMSISFIELVRGVPLITLLLMGIFFIGFFLPPGFRPGAVTRILIALVLFEGAYMAEVVRGGLQSVPKGQIEAAQAVGMSPWKVTRLVVLPQALRNTIPAMVGEFISLYKNTTLVLIVGRTDILRVSRIANANPEFLGQGLDRVTLPFVALLFWVGSYVMSKESRRLEKRLGVGER